jgi:hypothetical protein
MVAWVFIVVPGEALIDDEKVLPYFEGDVPIDAVRLRLCAFS